MTRKEITNVIVDCWNRTAEFFNYNDVTVTVQSDESQDRIVINFSKAWRVFGCAPLNRMVGICNAYGINHYISFDSCEFVICNDR